MNKQAASLRRSLARGTSAGNPPRRRGSTAMLARAAASRLMLPRRPAWHAACRASRAFSLAAQHRSPTSYLHDLVGDANQPGLLGGYGVKAVALVDVNAGEVSLRLRLSLCLRLRLRLSRCRAYA